jgi:hypothetical protein
MSGATASLPNLQRVSDASGNAQSGLSAFLDVAGALASGTDDSPLHAISQVLHRLDQALDIDVSGLAQGLPLALSRIDEALPADALRFVEEISERYQEVSDFLANSELVRQIGPGVSLEQTALALIDDLLAVFRSRLDDLGPALIDAETLARVSSALATIDTLSSAASVQPDELLDFLADNLLGVGADLLAPARSELDSALVILDPFSEAAVEARLAAARADVAGAMQLLGQQLRSFDPDDLAAYAALEAQLAVLGSALDTAFTALEALYATLTVAVDRPEWDGLFAAYADVLGAIDLAEVPTVDDAVDAMAAALDSLLSRLGMSLSPEDLAAQVGRMSASIHDLFGDSPLAQVRQILIDFIGQIRAQLDALPVEEVQTAVHGMLSTVHQQIDALGIAQVRSGIEQGFQQANDLVDEHIGEQLLAGVDSQLAAALTQFENIPIAELGEQLANAVEDAGEVIGELQAQISSGLAEVQTLLASLDGIDFRPVADEVVDEIAALKAKLAAIRPDALSDAERIAIQAGLSILRAIDLQTMIEDELKQQFAALDAELAKVVQAVLDAWIEFRGRIGGLDGASLAAPVTGLLDQVGDAVLGINGALVISPLGKLVDDLLDKTQALSPGALLDPLQEPYQRLLATIERANPTVWVQPLRVVHAEIDRLIDLVDVTPLLGTLEQKQKDLFGEARQAISDALDAVQLPAPLDAFYAQMKTLVLALTDAIFADPDTSLREINLSLSTSLRPSTLFEPLDQAFDRLLAMLDTLPEDEVVQALEAIRQGLGAALPAMNPAHIVARMRQGQGRIAALAPSHLAGVVALPGLRVALAGQLSLSTANGAAKVSLLARFDSVLGPLDLSADDSRLQRLSAAHATLLSALRRRINTLDASAAQVEFQRLETGLGRLLPAFLRQPEALSMADVRGGLATLRPSSKARRIDLAVERFLAQLTPLQGALNGAVDNFFLEIRQAALALHPGELKDAVATVYAGLHEKLALLDPDELAVSLRNEVWEPLLDPLRAIDPAALKVELDALFQNLVGKIGGSIRALLEQLRVAIDAFLVQVREALGVVLATLKAQIEAILASVGELLAQIDQLLVDDLFERLLTLLDKLQISFDRELDRVRKEFDAMLAAIPLQASAEVSFA